MTYHPIRSVVLAAALSSTLLSGCVPLVLGGAVVGGMMAMDRRSSGAQVEDEAIELRAASRVRELLGERGHVNVTSYNRQVLVTGEVPAERDREIVEQAVGRIDNVRSVVNELAIGGNSSLSQRSNDTLITGKVKASLVDARDVAATAFKVVTERGVVYLMGRVTQREADRATALTRGVSGVAKVVRVLEILAEEELQRMSVNPNANQPPQPRPAASAP